MPSDATDGTNKYFYEPAMQLLQLLEYLCISTVVGSIDSVTTCHARCCSPLRALMTGNVIRVSLLWFLGAPYLHGGTQEPPPRVLSICSTEEWNEIQPVMDGAGVAFSAFWGTATVGSVWGP